MSVFIVSVCYITQKISLKKKKDLGISSYNAVIIAGPAHPFYFC